MTLGSSVKTNPKDCTERLVKEVGKRIRICNRREKGWTSTQGKREKKNATSDH